MDGAIKIIIINLTLQVACYVVAYGLGYRDVFRISTWGGVTRIEGPPQKFRGNERVSPPQL